MRKSIAVALAFLFLTGFSQAQNNAEVAVMYLDSKGILLDSEQLTNLIRIELEKTNVYQVLDKYEMYDIIERKELDLSHCFGKSCLVAAGKIFGVDKVLCGNIERYGEKILITLRLVNIATSSIDRIVVNEYLNLQPEIQNMIGISIGELLGIQIDENLKLKLTQKHHYESAVRNPGSSKVTLSGPRMGVAYITGDKGERLMANQKNGGYDVYPYMTHFGYQHEVQYLNEGNFQAVFEMVMAVSGIDQGLFIPSITFMNGFRNNKYGFEFAFGPNFGLVKKAKGYYDEDGAWKLSKDWNGTDGNGNSIPNPNDEIYRMDRRGIVELSSGFVWAVGKTFKSGHLNIPVNAYVVPGKEGWYMGLTFGFNSKNN
ncbi:MAG: hypothetical protein JKX95_00970 [Bacteroidia bacterium]|nr:hypothetical protein [Bacteroidia bacterium]